MLTLFILFSCNCSVCSVYSLSGRYVSRHRMCIETVLTYLFQKASDVQPLEQGNLKYYNIVKVACRNWSFRPVFLSIYSKSTICVIFEVVLVLLYFIVALLLLGIIV